MNHIYKVVWNKAKGCYQVASEFAHVQGRSSSSKAARHMAAVLAVVALAGSYGSVAYAESQNDAAKDEVQADKAKQKEAGVYDALLPLLNQHEGSSTPSSTFAPPPAIGRKDGYRNWQ